MNASNPLVPLDGKIAFYVGALEWVLRYESGDFKVDDLTADGFDIEIFYHRGIPTSVRHTQMRSIPFSFTADAVGIIGDGTLPLLGDVALRKGVWSSSSGTLPAGAGDAYLIGVKWSGLRTGLLGATNDSLIDLPHCRLDKVSFAEGIPGKFSVSGMYIPIGGTLPTLT